jgi:hypothetical protein
MAFVFLSADAIDQKFRRNAQRIVNSDDPTTLDNQAAVRRPYRGIQIKDDTYASLSIVDGRGNTIALTSSSAITTPDGYSEADGRGRVSAYSDFIMQSIDDERMEKQQIVETFGDSFIFFFGEKPRIVNITGVLMNTEDFNWRSQFMYNYENFLRGSKLVQRNARCFLSYDQIVIEGYPIHFRAMESTDSPYMVQFQMSMFLTNYNDFSQIGMVMFPNNGVSATPSIDALNAELTEIQRSYIATGVDVRSRNLEVQVPSISAVIREGIRKTNSVINLVGNIINDVSTVLSGRLVRTPVGVAGFIAQVNQEGLAASGLTAFQQELELSGVSTKLYVPSAARYAPVDPTIWRSRFSDNIDEYPLRDAYAMAATTRLGALEAAEARRRALLRRMAREQLDVELVGTALAQEVEDSALTAMTDVIKFARTGFAMVKTIQAFADDPGAVIADALGVGELIQ